MWRNNRCIMWTYNNIDLTVDLNGDMVELNDNWLILNWLKEIFKCKVTLRIIMWYPILKFT